jgi:hypothetical protein
MSKRKSSRSFICPYCSIPIPYQTENEFALHLKTAHFDCVASADIRDQDDIPPRVAVRAEQMAGVLKGRTRQSGR